MLYVLCYKWKLDVFWKNKRDKATNSNHIIFLAEHFFLLFTYLKKSFLKGNDIPIYFFCYFLILIYGRLLWVWFAAWEPATPTSAILRSREKSIFSCYKFQWKKKYWCIFSCYKFQWKTFQRWLLGVMKYF